MRPTHDQAMRLRNLSALASTYASMLSGLRTANLRMHAAECVAVADAIDAGEDTRTTFDTVEQWIIEYTSQINAEIEGK